MKLNESSMFPVIISRGVINQNHNSPSTLLSPRVHFLKFDNLNGTQISIWPLVEWPQNVENKKFSANERVAQVDYNSNSLYQKLLFRTSENNTIIKLDNSESGKWPQSDLIEVDQ